LRYGSVVPDEPGMSECVTDTDAGLAGRQRAFRQRIGRSGIMVQTVASPDQLELLLYQMRQSVESVPLLSSTEGTSCGTTGSRPFPLAH
jgi:hypothetical protein